LNRKIILASLLALGVTGVWGSQVSADQTRKSITPLLKLISQYDSNFFKTPDNEDDAWTYIVQPGIEAGIETERSHASLYYTLDAYYYSGLDQDLDYVGHTFRLDTGTRSRSDKLHVNLRDTFRRTRDPAELDYLNNALNTEKFSINRFEPEFLYNFGRSDLRLAYGNVWVDYQGSDSGLDSVENRGTAELKFRFNRANALGLNFQYWNTDYDSPGVDSDSQQGKIVYARQNKKFLLEAGAGWQNRSFDMNSLDDSNLFVWDVKLQSQGLKDTGLTFRVDHSLNDQSGDGHFYKATKLAVNADYDFSTDLQGRFYGAYQNSEYEFTHRDDDAWYFEASLAYVLTRWLTVSGAVGTETRDSNVDAAEYDNVYGLAMFTFVYPIGTGSPVITPSPYNR